MDIYVVSNVWREQATIVGAAADLATARAIADRHQRTVMGDFHAPGMWKDWEDRDGVKTRKSLIWRARQEIVTLPLAGFVEDAPIGRTPYSDWSGAGIVPTIQAVIPEMPKPPTLDEMKTIMDRLREVGHLGPMRVGKGEAWDWLRRGLDQMATYPSEKAMPDSVVAQIWGIDALLDPDLPPNVIRLGDRVYVISEQDEVIYELAADVWDGSSPTSPRG